MQIVIDNYNINYRVTGDSGDTIVILQGWGTGLDIYNKMAELLSTSYRVVQLDFPGFGGSDEPREAWGVDDFADFVIAFFSKLGIDGCTLMGHSFGGRVIIKLAARENLPFTINKIVLIDSAGIMPKKSARQKLRIKWYKFVRKVVSVKLVYKIFHDRVDEWKSKQGSEDYRNATPIMRQCLVKAVNEDLTHLLPQIDRETLLIWGDKDTATPLEDGRTMERLMPQAGLAVISGAGHFCFLEQPVVFERILKSYFRLEG